MSELLFFAFEQVDFHFDAFINYLVFQLYYDVHASCWACEDDALFYGHGFIRDVQYDLSVHASCADDGHDAF